MVADTNNCSTTIPFNIGQPPPLVIDALQVTPETCPGSCDGTLTVVDPEGVAYALGGIVQPEPTFTALCAGPYAVTMVNAQGCSASSVGTILSPPPVEAGFIFSPDTIFVDDPSVHFINLSSPNAVTFDWDFAGLGSSTAFGPDFTFPGGLGAVYDVCLTAMDANGCTDEACVPIPVFDLLLVFVPNAFSPNGDGVNDTFLPIFNLPWVVDYQFMVFNRWGEQIFGTDLPGKPWKGDYLNVGSETEVYVWKLICKDQLSGERIERIGHVTLLK
jgi:gliding motility-associated-like protein